MQAQDRQEKERADARNALEEYVYELRGKLSEGESLHDFVAEDQRNKLVNQLDALEQWLYDEGEDQNRQVLNPFFYCFNMFYPHCTLSLRKAINYLLSIILSIEHIKNKQKKISLKCVLKCVFNNVM